ncbi:prealbumin-like fold domain-containing protein [Clostridium sp. AM58-1XD]|uniref:MSCRAMM family protein n=1 Tax=Clostridium sp. AM58-1XD TaxID=2292307 RepID=UPI000E508C1A|nr:prealbumin-like fold domain-containing protein [Clostridium sp. AM58-1XD]RGZ01541.1 hypothetical protein DXA13_01510 [Clostridium sp. AM58-1XD]
MLDTGRKYAVKETSAPEGYYGFSGEEGKDYILVDLTGILVGPDTKTDKEKIFDRGALPTGNKVSFENIPKPQLQVVKKQYDKGNGKTAPEQKNDVVFDIFQDYENPESKVGTIKSGSERLTLNDGVYYLKEQLTVDVINPNSYLTAESEEVMSGKAVIGSDGEVYWKVNLKKPSASGTGAAEAEIIQTVNIDNYKNSGSVTVKKFHAWTKADLSGAAFSLYRVDSDGAGAESETLIETLPGANGKQASTFTFNNKPIYGDDGRLITYRIRETNPPQGFQSDNSYFEFHLNRDQVVTKGRKNGSGENTDISFYNKPLISLTVKKFGRDRWESEFQPINHELPGIHLALLHEVEGNVVPVLDQNGEPVIKTTSADWAHVTFDNLSLDETYYIAEVYHPGNSYVIPDGKKPLLDADRTGKTLANAKNELKGFSQPAADFLNTFYGVKFNGETDVSADDKKAGKDAFELDPMVNEKNWVQFEVNKVEKHKLVEIQEEAFHELPPDERLTVTDDNGTVHYYKKVPLNNSEIKNLNGAKFELYSQNADDFKTGDHGYGSVAFDKTRRIISAHMRAVRFWMQKAIQLTDFSERIFSTIPQRFTGW